ncbi:MAG TPA: hypothetical protein VFX16_14510, partial [Pseudonocardiaceae bacterium]|nr:hypothetical protein [Pseudonocardiaceae bacterium]
MDQKLWVASARTTVEDLTGAAPARTTVEDLTGAAPAGQGAVAVCAREPPMSDAGDDGAAMDAAEAPVLSARHSVPEAAQRTDPCW